MTSQATVICKNLVLHVPLRLSNEHSQDEDPTSASRPIPMHATSAFWIRLKILLLTFCISGRAPWLSAETAWSPVKRDVKATP